MSSLRSLLGGFFGASSRLTELEKRILNCVRSRLDTQMAPLWDKQVEAINKVQRLPDGVEVDFYRMRNGKTTFDSEIAFPNKAEELQLATLKLSIPNTPHQLDGQVWCVKGFVFSIEYKGSVNYFEEAAGIDESTALQIECELSADLSASG